MVTAFVKSGAVDLDDRVPIQGTWKIVAGKRNGEPETDDSMLCSRYVFAGDELHIKHDGKTVVASNYKIDTAAQPAHITIVAKRNGREESVNGIYRLDRDRLTLCFTEPGRNRPTEFTTRQGDGIGLLVFDRSDDASD